MLKQRRKKANKKARVLKTGRKEKSSLLLHLFVAKPVRKRVEKFL